MPLGEKKADQTPGSKVEYVRYGRELGELEPGEILPAPSMLEPYRKQLRELDQVLKKGRQEVSEVPQRVRAARKEIELPHDPNASIPSVEADKAALGRLEDQREDLQGRVETLSGPTLEQMQAELLAGLPENLRPIAQESMRVLVERFPPDEYPYHNLKHSLWVMKESGETLEELREIIPDQVAETDVDLVQVWALAHDGVQDFTENESGFRNRNRGQNEIDSADELIERIQASDTGNQILEQFPPYEIRVDINATTPEPVFDEIPEDRLPQDGSADHLKGRKFLKISQPNIQTWRGMGLALADLKLASGKELFIVDGQETDAIHDGDGEYWEFFMQRDREIKAALEQVDGFERMSTDDRDVLAQSMLDWLEGQEGFVRFQEITFEEDILNNPLMDQIEDAQKREQVQTMLRSRYSNFQSNARAIRGRFEKWQQKWEESKNDVAASAQVLRELVADFGY